MAIYKKLLEVQKHVIGLKKDTSTGSYSGSYKYVSGDKVLSFIKPIMNDIGLLLKQEVVRVENELIKYPVKGGEKSEMLFKMWIRFTWIDVETGETDVNEFFSSGMNDFEKGVGSALTYSERYFLLKYFHIATDEDDIDNWQRKETSAVIETVAPVEKVTTHQIKKIHILVKEKGVTGDDYKKALSFFGVETSKDLTREQASVLIDRLSKAKKQNSVDLKKDVQDFFCPEQK